MITFSESLSLRRMGFRGALAALVLAVSPPQASAEDVDTVLSHFDNVVFGSEYAEVAGAKQIQKWMSPVRVSISAMQGKMLQKQDGGRELKLSYVRPAEGPVGLIRKHLTTLVKLTGIKSEEAGGDKKANFVIKLVPRLVMGQPFIAKDVDPAILKRLAKPGVCYFLTHSIRSGAMFRALIVVNAELPPDQMDACLLEEMTQAMGLPNDSDIVQPSVFNQESTRQTLSNTDVLLVETLYDKRLPAGTPRNDALRIARELLSEKMGGG